VKVMRNKDCDHTYRFAFPSKHIHQFIKDDMLCAGSSNYGPCPVRPQPTLHLLSPPGPGNWDPPALVLWGTGSTH
jgi:hypothetical protein